MKKTIKLTESDLNDLVKKVIEEQANYVLSLEKRFKFARQQYLQFLESSLRSLRPNEANEIISNDDQLLVDILEQTGNLLKMVRDLELEKRKNQPSFKDINPFIKK